MRVRGFDDGAEEIHIPQRVAHGAGRAEHRQLGSETTNKEVLGREIVRCRLVAIDTAESSRPANRTANVGTDTKNGTANGQQGRLTTGRSTSRQINVVRVEGATKRRDGLKVHDALGLVGLAVEDGTCSAKDGHHLAVIVINVARVEETNGCVVTLNGHVLLQTDRNTMKRTNGLAGLLQMLVKGLRPLEGLALEVLYQAAGELVGDGSTLGEGGGDSHGAELLGSDGSGQGSGIVVFGNVDFLGSQDTALPWYGGDVPWRVVNQ